MIWPALATKEHQPSTTEHQPSTTERQPSTTEYQPSTTEHKPSTTDEKGFKIIRDINIPEIYLRQIFKSETFIY